LPWPPGRLESGKGNERALSNGTLGEACEAAAALEKHPDLALEYPH